MSLAVLAVPGYLGGKLAYRYGVQVADETTQADGYTPAAAAACVPGPSRPSITCPVTAAPREPAHP